ncbi:RNA polymerase subunit RPO19 [Hypsugopox virus]|nr:RNA polymerase subunit RPO19 [Hypsugopox virus]
MADSGDIIDYVSEVEDDDSEYSISDNDNDEDDGNNSDSLETSDIVSYKQSNFKFESNSTHVEDDEVIVPQFKNISAKILALKKRYTRRISLFEITGIIAESYNTLQRGRLPLVQNLSDETLKQKMLHIIIQEIKEGTCPIIIEKNGELLSTNDFDKNGVDIHLDYIINIWKLQNRY